jgi:di/tricarboxylate transporter
MHHDDIRLRGREPAGKLVLVCDVYSEKTTLEMFSFVSTYELGAVYVAFVLAIILEATALPRKRANEVSILDACLLELLPEIGSPTTLAMWSDVHRMLLRLTHTGLPVIESPRGMMRTVDWRVTKSVGTAATAVVNDNIARIVELVVKCIFDVLRRVSNRWKSRNH